MHARRVAIMIILSLIAAAIVLGVICSIHYSHISKLCYLIETGDTEIAVQYIQNTHNVNCYTAPVWMRGIFNRLFEQDIRLPLVIACKVGNLDIVKVLLEQGADPNQYLKGNWSPIEAAIIGQKETRLEIIKTLVSYGADVNLFGSQQSALFVELRALMFNSKLTEKEQVLTKEIIEFLLKSGASPVEKDGSTLLHYLSYAGSLDMINAFNPDCRQFINAQNDHGQTPLMWAARGGNISVVEILIESGADIYTPDLDGKTAYDYAVLEGFCEMGALLIRRGQGDGSVVPYEKVK